MNRETFFAYVRRAPFGGRLTTGQVDGLNRILDEWERRGLTDDRWLAYMLATVFHETAAKMQPIREMGSEAYLRSKPYYPWVGEGLVQVTWKKNAVKFGAKKPGDLLSWPKALRALFDGMIGGLFTGKKLATYFSATKDDPVGARRIVNGTDKASLIAGYHQQFLGAIQNAEETVPPSDVETVSAIPDDVHPAHSGSVWAIGAGSAGAIGTGLVSAINNPWAFATVALVIVMAAVGAWLVFTGRVTINRRTSA